jgi:SH3-like domain-containing protein
MPNLLTVITPHTASYADPIVVTQGQPLILSGRVDVWDGHRWLWATAADGREGWVPDSLIAGLEARPVADRDYSAMELTCAPGERLERLAETHGWVWCRNASGEKGLVPLRCFAAG